MEAERRRQPGKLELIASENFVSPAGAGGAGRVLTNKYAEGYPGKRYYGGCEFVDVAEDLARDRAKQLFGAEHANVQPHSGAQANMAVYLAVLKPGDTRPGHEPGPRRPPDARHRRSTSPASCYEVAQLRREPDTERIDYDEVARPRRGVQPQAASWPAPRLPAHHRLRALRAPSPTSVGALLFVDMAHIAGLVAAGLHPSPFPHADIVTTTTHKTLRGPRGGLIFSRDDPPADLKPIFPKLAKGTLAAAVDKTVFPGIQGGPLMHVIAAKAVALLLAARDEFRRTSAAPSTTPSVWPTRSRARCRARLRRHGQPPHAGRRHAARGHRQGGRGEPGRRRHHGQQERHPLRPATAHHRLRHPRRHARRDHPRHGRGRDARDRRP